MYFGTPQWIRGFEPELRSSESEPVWAVFFSGTLQFNHRGYVQGKATEGYYLAASRTCVWYSVAATNSEISAP